MSDYWKGLDVLGCHEKRRPVVLGAITRRNRERRALGDVVGMFDIATKQHEMDAVKPVTLAVAQILLTGGQQAIAHANSLAKQPWYRKDLPGQTSRDEVAGHLKWHEDKLHVTTGSPTDMYDPGSDLKKWVMQAFIESNAAEEGAATPVVSKIWGDMMNSVALALAAIPKAIKATLDEAQQEIDKVESAAKWTFYLTTGAVVVGAGLLGYLAYKLATGPLGQTAVGVAVHRITR